MSCQLRKISVVAILAFVLISEVKSGYIFPKRHVKHKIQCHNGSGLSLLPHPTNCKKFYICYTKEPLEVQCPDGQHFDKTIIGTLNKCVPPEQSLCRDYGNGDFEFNDYFDEDGEEIFKIDLRSPIL